jgi:hypothetical protein
MLTRTRFTIYILFIYFQAIWLGSGFHESISTNIAWFKDPLTRINHAVNHPLPGAINAWPISTALLLLTTITAFFVFLKYKGKGKKEAFSAIVGTLVILLATFLYFVPTLIKVFTQTDTFSAEQLISMSRQWVILNFIRLFLLMALFLLSLLGLVKLAKQSA